VDLKAASPPPAVASSILAAHELDLQAFDLSAAGLELDADKVSYPASEASESDGADSKENEQSHVSTITGIADDD
jgi:hypothetical protein